VWEGRDDGRCGSVSLLSEVEVIVLAPNWGQHTNTHDCAANSDAPCSAAASTGEIGMVDRSDRSRRGSPTRIQRTPAWKRSRRSRRTLDYPRLGRPGRTSSNATEMKEEQHVGIGKARVKKKSKDDKK